VELSTILEVLRKAQEDARRKPEPGKVPGGLFDDAERRRRRRRLLFAVGAVVVLGFVGGWWFGARLRAPEPTAEDDGRLAVADATSPGRDAEPSAARSPGAEPGIGGTSAAPETKAEEPPAAKTAPAPAPATAPGAVEDARRAAPPAPEGSGAAAQPPSVPAAPPAAAKAAPQVPPAALRARAGDASSETALAAQRAAIRAGRARETEPASDTASAEAAAPAAPVGERRAPSYMDAGVPAFGPAGPTAEGAAPAPRLRAIQRPLRGTEASRVQLADRAAAPPPAAVAPAAPRAAGSFRDSDEVRIGTAEREKPAPEPREARADQRLARAESPLGGAADVRAESAAGAAAAAARDLAPAPARPPLAASDDGDVLARALRRSPTGAPDVKINIVSWSATPGRRFAFVRVDGSQVTQVREGDEIGGLKVKHIFQQAVEFGHGDSSFVLRAN